MCQDRNPPEGEIYHIVCKTIKNTPRAVVGRVTNSHREAGHISDMDLETQSHSANCSGLKSYLNV